MHMPPRPPAQRPDSTRRSPDATADELPRALALMTIGAAMTAALDA